MNIKNMENSFIGNITRVLSANFIVAIVGFLGTFIFPKILSVEDYAFYQEFILYVGYIGILHLGFSSGMAVNYAGKKYDEISKERYKSELSILLLILIIFTILFGIIWLITKNSMILYVTLAILPVCIINSYKSLYQAWEKFKNFSRVSIVISVVIPAIAIIYYLFVKELTGIVFIFIYILIYWIVSMYICFIEIKKLNGIQKDKIISEQNISTEKNGLALVVGNYINTLFMSVDKQFVTIFYGVKEFAYYTFGISMQSLMTVFITSIAQPLFPAIASGKIKEDDFDNIKKMLIIFGSFSGLAYFALSIIVKLFIQKYIDSLEVIGYYFVVFPAMAVINCLYVNLYKIKKMTRKYIVTIFCVLIISIILNSIVIKVSTNYISIAIATAVTYYIWLIIGSFQFKSLRLDFKDYIYLILYVIGFFVITKISNDYIGIGVYFIAIAVLAFTIYNKTVKYIYCLLKDKLKQLRK